MSHTSITYLESPTEYESSPLRSLHLCSTRHSTSHPPLQKNSCKCFMEQYVIFHRIQGFNSITKQGFIHYTKISSSYLICVWCNIITSHKGISTIRNSQGHIQKLYKEEFPGLQGSWKEDSLNYRPKCSQYSVPSHLHIKLETAGSNLQGYWAPTILVTVRLLVAGKLKIWLYAHNHLIFL